MRSSAARDAQTPNENAAVTLCSDYIKLHRVCHPPFGRRPTCYPGNSWAVLMGSESCAQEYARMHNVSSQHLAIVAALADTNKQLDQQCSQSTTEVRGYSAHTGRLTRTCHAA
jgi:hypothetical protein